MGCFKSYFIMDLITIATQLLLFSVKELLSEVIILGPTGRELGRTENKGVTADAVQVHRNRLKGIFSATVFMSGMAVSLPLHPLADI